MPNPREIIRQATLLIPSGPAYDRERKHLHIILNNPAYVPEPLVYNISQFPAGEFVQLVSLSTCTDIFDETCILDTGDHEFITHRSFIDYQRTRVVSVSTLQLGLSSGAFDARQMMQSDVFQRVHDGVSLSDETPRKMLKFWKQYC